MPLIHPSSSHPYKRRARTALLFLGALVFLFEEWLWIGCTQLLSRLGRLGLFQWMDGRLRQVGPVVALFLLCIPIAVLFPVKIAGLWMIASGRFLTGCCVMLIAKIVSTAIVARIFFTCRSQLMRMPWFARLYNVVHALRGRIHLWLDQQPAWREARRFTAWRPRGSAGRTGPDQDESDFRIRNGVLRRWRRARRKNMPAAARGADIDR